MKKNLKKYIPAYLKIKYRNYKKKQLIKIFEGNNVICCICNSRYREFMPVGNKKRKNAKCPNCGSKERHRLVWKYLNKKNLISRHIKILHFAPSRALYELLSVTEDIMYFPCDLMFHLYINSGMTKVLQADVTDIPFESNHFDLILCNHVLEHIPDDKLAMSELYRVMKNGGYGIFQIPINTNREHTYEDASITSPEGRQRAFGQHDHVRRYGKDYKDRLADAGFEVVEDDFVNTFSKEEQFKYGFMDSEIIYLCKKIL